MVALLSFYTLYWVETQEPDYQDGLIYTGLAALFFNLYFTCYELLQLRIQGLGYLLVLWNWLDLVRIVAIYVTLGGSLVGAKMDA